jgi:NHLM bacteriocin system secretion protein
MAIGLFREEALNARNRINALPRTMRVTNSLTKASLGILAVLTGSAVAWSAMVHVPVRVVANGVFIDPSGELLKPVRSSMEGVVEAILVNEGDQVEVGQPLVRLRLPERLAALDRMTRTLTSLEQQAERKSELRFIETRGDDKSREIKVLNMDTRISELEQRLGWQQSLETRQTFLLEKGITTIAKVYEVKSEVSKIADQLATARGELSGLLADVLIAEGRRERERIELAHQIETARAEVASIKSEMARGAVLNSPVKGSVAELSADRNGLITPGQVALSIIPGLESGGGALEVIVFVSLGEGKLVKPGAEVLLQPGSLPKSELARMRGTVRSVSEAPVTEKALGRTLGNTQLANSVSGGSAPFAVRISLNRDQSSPTGYAWTSGNAPELKPSPGTPISAKITIETPSLLSLVLPAIRSLLEEESAVMTKRPS